MERKKLSLLEYFIAALFGSTVLVIAMQIISRYVFNNSLHWTEEFSRYAYVWIIFLGAAIAVKEGTHVRIDILLQKLGIKAKRKMDILLSGLMFLTFSYFLYYGVLFVIGTNNSYSSALKIPINIYVYAALPLSCLIGMVNCIRRIIAVVKEDRG
jgi:TRAP-type C4-dicarboxylate transport system permease small subunit